MRQRKAILLAAGEGSRMKSKKAKVLHEVMGKSMVQRVVDVAKSAGLEEIAVIVGHQAEQVQEALKDSGVTFFLQQEQKGTGHAVMQAESFLEEGKDVVILYGDTPLLQKETLLSLMDFHEQAQNAVTIISSLVDQPDGYGRIVRDEAGQFVKNVEHKDASEAQRQIKEINSGIYCFDGGCLKEALKKINNQNAQGEYYLPDTLSVLKAEGKKVDAMVVSDSRQFLGVNTRAQLAQVQKVLQERVNAYWMNEGVTILDPATTYIADTVTIGMDTVIYPQTLLEGHTVIGENCQIGPCTRLTDMTVGDETTMQFTTAMESTVGSFTKVGPYAYIRPNCHIGNHIKVGDFVEVKNSVIGDGTKISHLTYVGDSDVGQNINFGCGTVTVNYDGKKKFRTVIEDNVFIGCNANLVAPVTLKEGSYVAAGSTITKDVPPKALAVARNRQTNLEGWSKK